MLEAKPTPAPVPVIRPSTATQVHFRSRERAPCVGVSSPQLPGSGGPRNGYLTMSVRGISRRNDGGRNGFPKGSRQSAMEHDSTGLSEVDRERLFRPKVGR